MRASSTTLGQRIKQLRTERGWSQQELAARVEVSEQTVYLWENDRAVPDHPNRVKLAKVFGITEPELHMDPARLVATQATDLIRAVLERLGYAPDDLTKLDEQDWKTIRDVLDPLIRDLLERKAKIGTKNPPLPKPVSVFIVEDEAQVCYSMVETLSGRGFDVDYAFNGEAALKRLITNGEKPDIILLDLRMPGMGGREFLQKIRNVNDRSKVVIVTGFKQDIADLDAHELRYEGYLEKPFGVEDLLAKVEGLLK